MSSPFAADELGLEAYHMRYNDANQSISANTWTEVRLEHVLYNKGFSEDVSYPYSIIIPANGFYLFMARVGLTPTATSSNRGLRFKVNIFSSFGLAYQRGTIDALGCFTTWALRRCLKNDVITLEAYTAAGRLTASSGNYPIMLAFLIDKFYGEV